MQQKKTFKQKWRDFFEVVFSPGSISPLVIAGVSLYLSTKSESPLSYALAIFASLMTAIAGYFIKDDWDRMRGVSLLKNKGLSAIRNLKAINEQINRIRNYIDNFLKSKKNIKDNLLEVNRHLSMVKFNIDSGIEDWIDVVPELDIFSEISSKETEISLIKKKISSLEKRDNKEIIKQKRRIEELASEIKKLKSSAGRLERYKVESPYKSYLEGITPEEIEKEINNLLSELAELQKQLSDLEREK